MPGKRVQFDDDTWAAIDAVARGRAKNFQQLADEAFKDLLKKYRQPVGLKAALKESVERQSKVLKLERCGLRSPIAQADKLEPHLAAEIARVVLAIGLDDDAYRAVERTEAHAGRNGTASHANHADAQLCRNPGHGQPMLRRIRSSCYVLS